MEKDTGCADSSDEGASGSDDEFVLLQAVKTIVTRSLKRSRADRKFGNGKRKKITRDRRQGRQVVDKDVSISKSRYHLNYLLQIMKGFDDDQKQIIRDAGFGALLEMDGGSVPWSFVQWLADHVDTQNEEMSFEDKSIPISVESYGHVLGIRTSGNPVPSETKTSTAEFLSLFGLTDLPTVKFFGDKIMKKGQSEDEFLVCFMVVAFSCFYCPTSSTKPSTAYLAGFIRTDLIKTYNWGKFVHEWNLFYINKYQRFSGTLAVCNYFLAVRYLDFVDFGTIQIRPTLPRLAVWKGDMIKEFIKLVMDEDNFYGKLPVKHVSETCYPFVGMPPPTSNAYSVEQLRNSIQALANCDFNEKVTLSICSLFEQCTLNEAESTCTKVQGLVIKVIECLVENNCISTGSQSTEKINQSQGDESTSNGSTLKLPSSDTSSNKIGNHDKATLQKQDAHILIASQHSANSVPIRQQHDIDEETGYKTTDQIMERLLDPKTKPVPSFSYDKKVDERVLHVNTALCNLQIKENMQECTRSDIQKDEKSENQGRKEELQSSSNKSASLEHMLKDNNENAEKQCGTPTSRVELEEESSTKSAHEAEDIEPRTPRTNLDMFTGTDNTEKGGSLIYINSSSIQCAQKSINSEKDLIRGIQFNNVSSSSFDNPELSSQTRNRSYSSQEKATSLDDMNIDDFGFGDNNQPSIPLEVAWQNAPRNQQLRNLRMRQEQEKNKENLIPPESPRSPIRLPESLKNKDTIIISSQESAEVEFLGEKQASPSSNSQDTEEVYIGEHRLSPIRHNKSEKIDQMYNQRIVSNQTPLGSSSSMSTYKTPLPPRRMVFPSKYVTSPYDQVMCSLEPTDQETRYYQSIVRLANMNEYMYHKAILLDKCKVSMETFGNSMKVRGVVEAYVINLFCRILFRDKHPKDSNRHTFFHTSSEYFLQKWDTEGKRLQLRDLTIKAFQGAGKAKKLHLTESLHFPSLHNKHWFLFTVDIRDRKFIFMDSYFDKNSRFHKEIDLRMMKNFKEIWDECTGITVDFSSFETVYPKVPQQNNNQDCGIFVMKNIELFSPRTNLMGLYSFKDIPKIRIQIANYMMFCKYNEMDYMKKAVLEFDPAVDGTYARHM